mmetsp:Transcript_18786/g.72454  ORF Transcript_18786/g.72454 Transcript_18786/m.72454 type:complete len:264 (-) Transcript_18786:957-1748(-)
MPAFFTSILRTWLIASSSSSSVQPSPTMSATASLTCWFLSYSSCDNSASLFSATTLPASSSSSCCSRSLSSALSSALSSICSVKSAARMSIFAVDPSSSWSSLLWFLCAETSFCTSCSLSTGFSSFSSTTVLSFPSFPCSFPSASFSSPLPPFLCSSSESLAMSFFEAVRSAMCMSISSSRSLITALKGLPDSRTASSRPRLSTKLWWKTTSITLFSMRYQLPEPASGLSFSYDCSTRFCMPCRGRVRIEYASKCTVPKHGVV